MRVAYVCVNYNTVSFTLEAVRSFLADTNHDRRVVVVDNMSEAGDVEELRRLDSDCERVSVLFLKNNIGYFPGLNQGLRHLREVSKDWDWIVVGNNDLVFPGGFFDRLADKSKELSVWPVVSPDILAGDSAHQNPHVISRISAFRQLVWDLYYSNYLLGRIIYYLAMLLRSLSDRPDEKQWQRAQLIHQGHGSCYLLSRGFFEHFEQLWAPTLLMGEEFFISKQLNDIGYQVYYEPAIQVLHCEHATVEGLPSRARWQYAREAHRLYREHVGIFR